MFCCNKIFCCNKKMFWCDRQNCLTLLLHFSVDFCCSVTQQCPTSSSSSLISKQLFFWNLSLRRSHPPHGQITSALPLPGFHGLSSHHHRCHYGNQPVTLRQSPFYWIRQDIAAAVDQLILRHTLVFFLIIMIIINTYQLCGNWIPQSSKKV